MNIGMSPNFSTILPVPLRWGPERSAVQELQTSVHFVRFTLSLISNSLYAYFFISEVYVPVTLLGNDVLEMQSFKLHSQTF